MLVQLGQKRASTLLIDAIADCHTKIRTHIDLASRLAGGQAASDEEVRQTAARVVRYFKQGLPVHVRDEEDSLDPRLRALSPNLAQTLDEMTRMHASHEPILAELITIAERIENAPQGREELSPLLGRLLATFGPEMERHLLLEERELLPAVGHLGPSVEAVIRQEIAGRRGSHF